MDYGLTNFDHTIKPGTEDHLRSGGDCHHAAREFHGNVRFEDGVFVEEVWRHHNHVDTVSAESLPELMKSVNDRWGWD